jgi:EAL domain-containing protein (putative c-di-GMP-specific phosphodiesterase class I)
LSDIDPSALIATMDLSIGDLARERIEETIKLTASLIQFVENRLGSRDSLTSAMTALNLMLIEVALVDKDFLLTSNHPSRLFLDRLVEYATLVAPGDTRAMTTIADLLMELHGGFVGDAAAFTSGILKLEPLTIRLIKNKQQNIDRVISGQTASELREQAKQSLIRVLRSVSDSGKISSDVLAMFRQGLTDSLVLKLLQGATETEIDALLKPISVLWHPKFAGTEQPMPDEELTDLTVAIDKAAGLEHERSAQLNAAIKRALELAKQGALASSDEGFELAIWEIFPEQARALETRPRLRRKVEMARRLSMRSWINIQSDNAPHQFLQLVWKNSDSSRFAFTDERGKLRLVLSAIELGSKIDRSITVLNASQQLTLVEQTLFGRLKDAQSTLIETSTTPASGVDMQIIKIERHLRRAKRKGTSQSLVVVSDSTQKLLSSIEDIAAKRDMPVEALHNGMMGVGSFVVDSVDSAQLDALVDDIHRETGASLTWHPLAADISDARRLLTTAAPRTTGDPKADQINIEQGEIDYRPIALADAVPTTLQRLQQHLKPNPGVLPMVRVPVDQVASIEAALLVTIDGAPDFSREHDQDIGLFLQTDVIIAFDLYKVSSACDIFSIAQDSGKSLPNLHIRLSTETCLFGGAIDHLLSIISETGVGTELLHFEFRDSVHIRLSKSAHNLSAALRSIGCKIIVTDLNPARGDPVPLQRLRPHSVLFDSVFWHNAALEEPWLSLLPTVITDVHHLLNESVGVRDPADSNRLSDVGIDYIERVDRNPLSIEEDHVVAREQ